jgi:hypothetical protein
MKNDNDVTKDWEYYTAGKSFNNRLEPSYYDTITTNGEMYNGNQWIYSNTSDELPKPVFNLINRIISFFVASLTTNATKITYSSLVPIGDEGQEEQAIDILNAEMQNFYEQQKIQDKIRQLYLDSAITGDMALHLYVDADKMPYEGKYSKVKGVICADTIDGNNVYFGNPNNRDVQSQPHIIIAGRATVEELQEEYDAQNNDEFKIASDSDTNEQSGEAGKIEIQDVDHLGKATYIIVYKKKKVNVKKMVKVQQLNELTGEMEEVEEEETEQVERVFVSKSIKDKYIYENVDTGLKLYPLVFNNWEHQKNNYHGRALCTSIVPNQIFINRMFAMAMYHLMLAAFPKVIYDAGKLSGWSNKIGAAIPIKDRVPGDNLNNIAQYLEPGQMSTQIVQFIELAIETTKDMLGANNALLGSVNPEMASGTSITVAARQSGVPLENPKNNMYELLDDLGRVFLDMVTANYGERPVALEQEIIDEQGQKQTVKTMQPYDFKNLENIYLSTKVDVGATTYWNEIAMIQTLDNLLEKQHITFKQYLERVPTDYITMKNELLRDIEEAMQQQLNAQPDMNSIVAGMSPEMQQQFATLPPDEQQALIQEYMQQQGGMQ